MENNTECELIYNTELLKEYNRRFKKYDSLKDEELEILDEYGNNKDNWDDELIERYYDLVNEINKAYEDIKIIVDFVDNN